MNIFFFSLQKEVNNFEKDENVKTTIYSNDKKIPRGGIYFCI